MKFVPYQNKRNAMFILMICIFLIACTFIPFYFISDSIVVLVFFHSIAIIAVILFLFLFLMYANHYLIFNDDGIILHRLFRNTVTFKVEPSLKVMINENERFVYLWLVLDNDVINYACPIPKRIYNTVKSKYESNISTFKALRDVYRSKVSKIPFIIIGAFLGEILLISCFVVPITNFYAEKEKNRFIDEVRMTDYAYIDRTGTLYYVDQEVVFSKIISSFENNESMEKTGSCVIDEHNYYFALTYLNEENYTFEIEFFKGSFDNQKIVSLHKETNFKKRPYTFSGFDSNIHAYNEDGTYLFSYDIASNIRVDLGIENNKDIADKYYSDHGVVRTKAKEENGTLYLTNGQDYINLNIKEKLDKSLYSKLTKYRYNAQTITFVNDYSFIIFESNSNYDLCLRYDWNNDTLTFANTYKYRYGTLMNQLFIPVLPAII